jgi:ElaB/YqjD/DUF883 family membrane-anchored ribosome-binding protein
MKTKTDRTPRELLHDLQSLIVEAETMMADSLSEHSAAAFKKLRARYEAAQERFNAAYSGARENVIAGAKYTDETIRANPYQSLAIAAGVGVLVGVLVARRSGRSSE